MLIKPNNVNEILRISESLQLIQSYWEENGHTHSVGANGWLTLEAVKLLTKEFLEIREELDILKGRKND